MIVQALKNFRLNLREAMDFHGFTQRFLANQARISYPYLNRILIGTASPSLVISEDIATAAGFDLEDLISPQKEFRKKFLKVEKIA